MHGSDSEFSDNVGGGRPLDKTEDQGAVAVRMERSAAKSQGEVVEREARTF
eukprot:COSAG02_NODE_3138_length_7298_cov_4.879289_5_plen_51_part_00